MEEFLLKNYPYIFGFVAVLFGIITAHTYILKVWKLISRLFLSVYTWFKAPGIVLETLKEQDQVLALIKKQLFPNGGSSLVDKLNETLIIAKRSERRSLILAEGSKIPSFECDSMGLCTWVNPALAELFGMEKSSMLGTGWLTAIDSSDKTRVWKTFTESLQLKIPYSCEYTVVNQKTGQRVPCYATAEVIRDIKDSVIFTHGIVEPKK